jgi:hypothetical protein
MRQHLLAAAVVATTAFPAQGPALQTHGAIVGLAADGPRVAVAVHDDTRRCGDLVLLWNAARGGFRRLSDPAGPTCPRLDHGGGGIRAVALAGMRAAWTTTFGGNSEATTTLYELGPGEARERAVGRARWSPDSGAGDHLDALAASGDVLVYQRVRRTAAGAVTRTAMRRLDDDGIDTLAHGPAMVLSRSVNAGRIATLDSAGTVRLHTAAGRLVGLLRPPSARAVALLGDRLVVLTATASLEVYDTATGELAHRWPIEPGTHSEVDASAGFATYTRLREVHAVRLADGVDRVVADTPRSVTAQIEPSGLVYAYTTVAGRPAHFRGVVRSVSLKALERRFPPLP